ncbi:hypothetical protein TYRP_004745 [Tyrophagus putrescentiae]|nr:hypothetical protein TYRP_004745 [Tyrophagus putrescentiae]
MRHSRIIKSTRHKKLKAVNELCEFNYVNTQSTKDQGTPNKVAQIMEFKAKSKQAATQPKSSKRSLKVNKKYNTLTVKTGAQTTIEKGMTRAPKTMPEKVEKGILESEYQFINRLNRMVSKSIAEATLEEHFDVDLGGKVNSGTAEKDDKMNFLTPEESKKLEKRKEKQTKFFNRKHSYSNFKHQAPAWTVPSIISPLPFASWLVTRRDNIVYSSEKVITTLLPTMSTACEAAGSEVGDASQSISKSQSADKAAYEEEELDYEEEMEYHSKTNNILKNDEEEGELSDDTNDEQQTQANPVSKDKDEGEIDDEDDLEEGEVKEDEDEGALADVEDSAKVEPDPRRNRNFDLQPDPRSSTSRPDNQRYSKPYYSNNYHNSRPQYSSRSNDRYTTSSRVRDYNNYTAPTPAPAASQTESAWERGLKQARELLSKASKRKEEEVDFENKRFNMTTGESNPPLPEVNVQFNNNRMRSSREKSPIQKRRRHSPHSSSEDEVERRHRLAYDAAPWNNPSSSNYQSSNYRSSSSNRPNYSSSNRSAETYRDPWRRSKSPKTVAIDFTESEQTT